MMIYFMSSLIKQTLFAQLNIISDAKIPLIQTDHLLLILANIQGPRFQFGFIYQLSRHLSHQVCHRQFLVREAIM